MNSTERKAKEKLRRYKADPVYFVTEEFNPKEIDDFQLEVLRAFPTHQRLAVGAAKGAGKTALESWLIWNFLSTRVDSQVAATSISSDQLQDGLWKELATWQQRSPLLKEAFEWQKTRIVSKDPEHSATWYASARSWAKSADAQAQSLTLAGLHAENMMVVLDESGSIPMPIAVTAEAALASGADTKLVQMGNTTSRTGPLFAAMITQRHLWFVVKATGDPEDPKRAKRISRQWAQQQIELFGRNNPWVKVNVFAEFPETEFNALLSEDEVMNAMKRQLKEEDYSWAQKRLGIDVARFGDDRTVILKRQGLNASWNPDIMRGARTTDISGRVLKTIGEWGSELELVDDTGHWGHGVIDNLIAVGRPAQGVQFHAPALDPRYNNRRTEGWLEMANWVKRGGALPRDCFELIGELSVPTYTYANGKFMMEEKDQVKLPTRLGRSPDIADALALTFMLPEMPGQVVETNRWGIKLPGFQSNQVEHEFDPLAEGR
jgi:hypothetical protein